ncbi:MAG: RidA family protein, partial [Vicinamibacterales bacterium]
MPKEYINPASLFASQELGFSQAVATSGAARTLYVSGQTAWDADGRIVGMDLAAQTSQAFRNVDAAVKAGGGTIDDVVSLRIYVVGLGDDSAAAAV